MSNEAILAELAEQAEMTESEFLAELQTRLDIDADDAVEIVRSLAQDKEISH